LPLSAGRFGPLLRPTVTTWHDNICTTLHDK
jgi:hypothetical protein